MGLQTLSYTEAQTINGGFLDKVLKKVKTITSDLKAIVDDIVKLISDL